MGEHAGLPAARAGKDEQRAIGGLDGLTLGRIQPLQQGRRPDRRAQACAPVAGAGAPGRRVVRIGPAIGVQMVARRAPSRLFDGVEIDVGDEQLLLILARRAGHRPAIGAHDDRRADEGDAALDADAIRAGHDHAVLRSRGHRHVVALAVPAVVPDRALEGRHPVGGHRDDLGAGERQRPRGLREPEVEADDHADPPEREGRRSAARRPAGTMSARRSTGAACDTSPCGPTHRSGPSCCACSRRRAR